jgi:hypothetical protein
LFVEQSGLSEDDEGGLIIVPVSIGMTGPVACVGSSLSPVIGDG